MNRICLNSSSLLRSILWCVVWLAFSKSMLAVPVTNTDRQTAPLLEYILVNDTIKLYPQPNNEGYHQVDIETQQRVKNLTMFIDSAQIVKYNLVKYRFIDVETGNEPTVWQPYPVKEILFKRKTTLRYEIQAINNAGLVFTDNILIHNQKLILNNPLVLVIVVILAILFLIITYLWVNYRQSNEKSQLEREINLRTGELVEQKEKYEEMLTNYLPKEEFEKLKDKDKTIRYKMVTVLFSNILGFTKIAEQEDAERLIDDLDRFSFEFDSVVEKLHIEKIKTIGDSYMCAGGIPQKNRTNPIEVVLAAFEMQQYMQMLKDQYVAKNQKIWDLRMGIHTGPVFSNGSSNKKRLEIWGDTVNIASRMEASGETGKVNITGMTYELVKDYFLCQYRGKMPVKYKGEIDMYFIEGFRPALSVDGIGLKPNSIFVTRLGLIRFDDLEEDIMTRLDAKLPRNLYYHNLKHTIDVTVQVEIIGRHENISDEELLLLKTAALFHDTGFMFTYKNHEEAGAELAREVLPGYDYTPEQINRICELIMVTKLPPRPTNLLEQIMCDSDLDYLGRVDFIPVSGNLFRELTEYKIIESDIDKWNMMQISFIEKHQYFTESAKRLRDVNKNNQLEAIRRLVKENN